MKKFVISIEERICEDFNIEADSIEEAIKIAEDKYKKGELVLNPGEVQEKLMMAHEPETNESTEWKGF